MDSKIYYGRYNYRNVKTSKIGNCKEPLSSIFFRGKPHKVKVCEILLTKMFGFISSRHLEIKKKIQA